MKINSYGCKTKFIRYEFSLWLISYLEFYGLTIVESGYILYSIKIMSIVLIRFKVSRIIGFEFDERLYINEKEKNINTLDICCYNYNPNEKSFFWKIKYWNWIFFRLTDDKRIIIFCLLSNFCVILFHCQRVHAT